METEKLINVVVLSAVPAVTQAEVANLDRANSDSVAGFVRVKRRGAHFQLVFGSEATADLGRFASVFVLVGGVATGHIDRLRELRVGATTVLVGPGNDAPAQASRSAWVPTLHPALFDCLEGAYRLGQPVPPGVTADRGAMVKKLSNSEQLVAINNRLKEAGLKHALDLYLAASNVDHYETCMQCVTCPHMLPFLASKREAVASPDRKAVVLAALQNEILNVLHPLIMSEKEVAAAAMESMSLLVVNKNLSNIESLIICDQSRWYLLKAVLFANQFEALPDPLVVSPRTGPLSGTLSRRAPTPQPISEGVFVWEAVEGVLQAHGQQSDFSCYLVEEDMAACTDPARLFREDSVATKWMARILRRSLPAVAAVLGEAVSHVMYGTLSLEDVPNSLVLLLSLFKSVTQLDVELELRLCLARCREVCERTNVDPIVVCGRLVLLRWIGPLLLNPVLLVGKSAGPEQLEQLKIASKLLVHIGEGTLVSVRLRFLFLLKCPSGSRR
jgi:hypothetical protein